MCRWVAYYGNPIHPEALLYDTEYSLVEQSRRDRLAGGQPNADGVGLGWYGERETPGLYRSVAPAWGDRNLREIAGQVHSPLFLAHIRAATGTPVEQTNCHPFRHGRWLFMHNGFIDGYLGLRRELLLAVDPALFPGIEGTTDSELMFHLALTFGLQEEPLAALERWPGSSRRPAAARRRRAAADDRRGQRRRAALRGPLRQRAGGQLALRHRRRERRPRDVPRRARFRQFSDEARAVVSEPLGDLPGLWHECPPAPRSSSSPARTSACSSRRGARIGATRGTAGSPRPAPRGDRRERAGASAIESCALDGVEFHRTASTALSGRPPAGGGSAYVSARGPVRPIGLAAPGACVTREKRPVLRRWAASSARATLPCRRIHSRSAELRVVEVGLSTGFCIRIPRPWGSCTAAGKGRDTTARWVAKRQPVS